jgi:pheromone shutdown protein TraB
MFVALRTETFFGESPCQLAALAWVLDEVGVVRELVRFTAFGGGFSVQSRFSARLLGTAFIRGFYVPVALVVRAPSYWPSRAAVISMLGAQLARLVFDINHVGVAMLAAESSPFARHAKVGLLSAQLALFAYDVHHADFAMLAAESSPFARHAKGGPRSAQLARLV